MPALPPRGEMAAAKAAEAASTPPPPAGTERGGLAGGGAPSPPHEVRPSLLLPEEGGGGGRGGGGGGAGLPPLLSLSLSALPSRWPLEESLSLALPRLPRDDDAWVDEGALPDPPRPLGSRGDDDVAAADGEEEARC